MNMHQAYEAVLNYFHGDKEKTIKWFQTRNPSLGSVSPLDMIKARKEDKLIKFIKANINGYLP